MDSPYIDAPWLSPTIESFDGSFNICIDDSESSAWSEVPSSVCYGSHIPEPPPPPCKISTRTRLHRMLGECYFVPKETKDMWDKLFKEGYGADVYVITEEREIIPAHSSVLTVASPILANYLHRSEFESGIRFINIPGVPHQAVCMFVRFLYSSCYEEEDMKNFVLHLLVLSHIYSIPSLKRVCVQFLEHAWLTTENVIDVLQLARNCDAPRLSLICVQMIVRDFKTISSTEGWKVMKRANPALEQELLESVVEADSREKERLKKLEEKKVYLQLDEAMEALLHICRDGCGTIGPRDKVLKGSQVACDFPACKGVESLVRHFSMCKIRVPGGHFKEKMQQKSKKDEAKWTTLVSKVLAAKNAEAQMKTLSLSKNASRDQINLVKQALEW
ncbi:hypothetical protein RHGRI_004134 [Rhododendron griersonianum]|uniref:BTB domain-containing protein n=1 Tax=Rhododendron griersonianum TaxID=479676 RepID=A0AAV6L7H5_9ERIC|nr:hypothetical protein RHGRI_004134 [Rhododendron griersonianum]KAG5561008.1 hypothetical protein RHGRI_004134 [Rhododendron griersonianum]KAG5561009.1 hypothetical protein RHGRI_004134 [Rhododendron griersonianum]